MSARHYRFFVTSIVLVSALHYSIKTSAADPQTTPAAKVRWLIADDFTDNAPHNPVVVNDCVIVGTDMGEVHCYNCSDGDLKWVYNHGKRIFHRPCSDGEYVYFTSEQGVFAVTLESGAEVWSAIRDHCNGPLLASDEHGLVIVGGSDGFLYALDADDGEIIWTSDCIADAPDDPPGFSGDRARMSDTKARPSSVSLHEDTIFLSIFDQCRVVSVDIKDGKRISKFQSKGWILGAATATKKHVFFGSQDRHFYCFDRNSGAQLWSIKTGSRIEAGGTTDDSNVYFGSCDGHLYCADQASGKVQWKFEADRWNKRRTPIYSIPLLHNGNAIFAAGEGQSYAVNTQTGKQTWKIRPVEDSEMFCSPDMYEGVYFFVTRAADEGVGRPALVAIDSE